MIEILLLALFLPCGSTDNCPTGTIYSDPQNVCLKFETSPATFLAGEERCVALGGHLTSVGNAFEHKLIQDNSKTTFAASADFWIGANRGMMSSNWSWTDQTPMSYTNWAVGENLPMHPCASQGSQDGFWRPSDCTNQKPYVCGIPNPKPTEPPRFCPSDWMYFEENHHCYHRIFPYEGDFSDAEYGCREDGAHLVSIHSESENQFVVDLAAVSNQNEDWDHQVGIGLQKDEDGYIYWTDGTEVDYQNWAPGEPDKEKEQCVELLADSPSEWGHSNSWKKWNDVVCSRELRIYICKKPATY